MMNFGVGENWQLLQINIDLQFKVEGKIGDGRVGDIDLNGVFI